MEDYPYPLLVEGDWSSINAKTLQTKVHIYFQSRKKSQGGDCVISWSERSCTVFFKSQEIRDQVLSQAGHTIPIEKQVLKLKVSKPDSESHTKEKSHQSDKTGSDVSTGALQPVPAVRTACSVLVENVPADAITIKQFLELYFEKWGGPVEKISTNPEEQTIIVKFHSQDAAKRILEKTDHRLSSQPVIMRPYFGIDANQTEASEGLKDTPRSSAVVLENVPENLNQEYLMLLVDSVIGHSEDKNSLELIPESNAAVVTFNDPRAVQTFLTECRNKRKFQEHGLKARHLEKSRSVKVENLPEQCPEDFLELYFENHAGPVERIKAVADEKAAIVTFRDQQAVQKVLGTAHFIRKTPVDIYPYYTSLGSALYGKDRPTWTLPKPFTYKIHPAIREFLQKRGQISSISYQMSSHFCQVNMDKDEVVFSPLPTLLRQKGLTRKHIDSWKQDTIDAFKNILSNFGVFEYTVNPSVLTAREKDIRSVVKDKAVLKVDLSTGSLTLAGTAKDINVLKPILENDLKKASSQMERDMNKTSETIYMPSATFLLLQQEGLQHNAFKPSEGLKDTPRSSAVVLENVPENLNQEYLRLLVDSVITHSEDEYSLELIPESNTAVVTFNDPRAVQTFLTECRNKRKFQEHDLKARHLEKSRSVKVENLPEQCPEDFLEIYFEKHVGPVERIKAVADEKAAIVTFRDQQAVQKVLGTAQFIRKTPVDIYPYYTSLGSALYGKDRPTWTLPKPFTYKIHPAIREFLQKRGQISSISYQMSSHFCQVNMDKDEVVFSPLPTLLRQKGRTKKYIDSWKQDTIDAFENILSNFGVFEYTVNPSILTAREKDIRSVVKDKAVLKVDLSTGCLTLAGMGNDINMLKPILENDLKKASNQMERDMNKTSETIYMSSATFLLLQQEGLQQSASAKYPELELTYKKDTNQLRFSGLLLEIVDIKNFIFEKQLSMKEKSLTMDPLLVEFLRSVDSEELSKDLFTSKGISAVYNFENENIILTASSAKALTDAEKRLEMMLTLQNLSVEDLGVLGRPDWHDLTNQLYETYNSSRKKTVLIKSSNNRDTVVVYGFQEPVREVSKSLEQFIDTHSMTEEIIRARSYAMVKYIRERMPHVWQKFLKGDELNINYDPKRPLIRVSGERIHVQPVLKSFQNIIRSLHTDKLTIRKAGAKKFFQEQIGIFTMMLKEQRFVFVLEDASMEEEDEERYNEESYAEGRVEDFGQLSCEVQTPGGIVIKVLKADFCKFKVDAVVNAANEDLKHIGGLALALLNAAGPSLQQISDRYVAAHGKLQPGNAVTTDAGRLPCRYVVHAVGPRYYNTDKSTSVKKLRQAVRESLNQAVFHRCSSIALPAISSGIFGFPLDHCTETIAQELLAYIEDQTRQAGINTLKNIYLVDNNPKTVNAMAQAVKKEFAQFSPRMQMCGGHGHGQNYHGHGNQSHGYHGQGAGRRQDFGEWKNDARAYGAKDSEDYETQTQFEDMDRSLSGFLETRSTKEGLKIILRKGDIQDARSDVIVNSISDDLDLSKGTVSRALLNAAGPQLQAEINSMRKHGTSRLNPGELVFTNGYNLHCQMVFQTVCPFWNGGSRSEDEILKRLIQSCLKTAENKKMTSITFPAIGTGNIGFPRDLVARILLSEIHAFSAKVSPQFLNEVTVIVHPSDTETVQSFVKSFRGEWKGPVMKNTPAVQQSPAKKPPPVRPPQSAGFLGTVSTPSLGVHKMQIGTLMLEVSSGDITKESCDAIINSSNQAFSLKSGVSKAILDTAGVEVEMECAQIVASQSQQSEMIMTSGGQLPCRFIIHIIGRNSPADIKHVVYSVLKLCEEKRFSSVAFPALGTGQGGAPPSAVADAMIDAVIDFVKKKKGTNLQNVKFLIFQTTMLSDFHESMLKRQQKSVEEGGIIGWFKDTFGKFFGGDRAEASANEEFVFVGEEFEPVVFQLCGETEEDLSEARNLITGFIVKEHMSSKIQDSAINYFNQEESDVLSKLERELTVSIKLSKSGPEPELTIEGLKRDVAQAENQIRDMIRKVEKNLTRHREAFMLSSQVEWQYQDLSNNVVPFDILTNYDLEQALTLKQPRVMIKINNHPYEAHLPSLNAKGNNGKIKLKRTDLRHQTAVSLPSHWEDMKGKLVLRVTIQQGSQEYANVEKEFTKTGLISNILQIERVQNETLWKNYMNQKAYLDKKNNHTNNEKLLFHGTGSDNIDKINERGFNRSFAGMHGAMHGNGVYFAVDPRYSARGYAKPDLQGHKRMYWARVLVGDFTTGKAGLVTPPAKKSTGTEQYDSVTDPGQSMFVIFHDVHAYPEYLITFQ